MAVTPPMAEAARSAVLKSLENIVEEIDSGSTKEKNWKIQAGCQHWVQGPIWEN